MVIRSADVGQMPKDLFDAMPKVTVTYEDGTSEVLFSYYPDEISFNPKEFVGLTRAQAFGLRQNKDIQYLQS